MRCALRPAPHRRRCTLRRYSLAAGLMLAAAVAFAQTPATPAAAEPLTAADAALVARAADLVYKREIARLRVADALDNHGDAAGRARKVANRLMKQATQLATVVVGWSWAVSVDARDEPMAWFLPNGAMMVSWGLVARLALSDSELAAILAHVIAHQLTGADTREALAAYRRRHSDPDPDENRAAAELADILGKAILSPNYDARTEKAADTLALELLARSALDPRAAVSAWRKLAQSGSTRAPGLLALHPAPPGRIADLEAQVPVVMPLYEAAVADAAAAKKARADEKKLLPPPAPRRPPRPPQY